MVAGYSSTGGNMVVIRSNNIDPQTGDRLIVRYLHLLAPLKVEQYKPIQAGDEVGYTGNTGEVIPKPNVDDPYAGTHLHFDVNRAGKTSGMHFDIEHDTINPQVFFPPIKFTGNVSKVL